MNLVDIMPALAQPFPVAEIDFLPKKHFEKDGKAYAPGLPFADKRVYEDRLNDVCPGEWSTQAQMLLAGDKLVAVVTVVICGVPHTDVGESPLSSENAATESFAQAFKRACSQAGLGRYLYSLEKQFLPWDKERKRFALTSRELLATVEAMYRKAGLLSSTPSPVQPPAPVPAREPEQATNAPATAEQLKQISFLARKLRRQVTRPQTYSAAQSLLAELQAS